MDDNLLSNRLLVIDNEPALGRLVKNVAEAVGFEVFFTKNPSVFAETARNWCPTALMLDLGMPGTDGIQQPRGLVEDRCAAHVIFKAPEAPFPSPFTHARA